LGEQRAHRLQRALHLRLVLRHQLRSIWSVISELFG
jgi:hypothetical protein